MIKTERNIFQKLKTSVLERNEAAQTAAGQKIVSEEANTKYSGSLNQWEASKVDLGEKEAELLNSSNSFAVSQAKNATIANGVSVNADSINNDLTITQAVKSAKDQEALTLDQESANTAEVTEELTKVESIIEQRKSEKNLSRSECVRYN